MTIEEAIAHCREVAAKDCTECGKEHLQLAGWLTELKQRREREEAAKKPKTNGDKIRAMTDEMLSDVLTDKCAVCAYHYSECETTFCICEEGVLKWLKQEVSEDAGSKTD